MQTRGQVSSAPVLQGSRAGRECLALEGSPRLAPTRASSASSSSSTFREVTRSSLPPDRRTCFSAQLCPPPPVHLRRSHTRKWAICHRCRRGAAGAGEHPQSKTSVRGCLTHAKLGVLREGKRTLQESFIPTENARPIPPKSTSQVLIVGHPYPTILRLRSAQHPQGAARLGMCQSWKRCLFGW